MSYYLHEIVDVVTEREIFVRSVYSTTMLPINTHDFNEEISISIVNLDKQMEVSEFGFNYVIKLTIKCVKENEMNRSPYIKSSDQ